DAATRYGCRSDKERFRCCRAEVPSLTDTGSRDFRWETSSKHPAVDSRVPSSKEIHRHSTRRSLPTVTLSAERTWRFREKSQSGIPAAANLRTRRKRRFVPDGLGRPVFHRPANGKMADPRLPRSVQMQMGCVRRVLDCE